MGKKKFDQSSRTYRELTPRPYQQEAIDAVPEKGRVLLVLATGLGKTVIFSHIRRYGRTLILSHRDELVTQPISYFPPDVSVGIEKASYHSDGEDVVSASVQTLARGTRLEKSFQPGDFHTIIIDEAHHAAAKSYKRIIDYLRPERLIGVTATPRRGDRVRLNDVFDSIIFDRDIRWGISNGYLADLDCMRVDVGISVKNVKTKGKNGDFADGALEKAVNKAEINEAIAEAYEKYAVGQTIIFTAGVMHAFALQKLIEGSEVVTGETPRSERKEIIERFQKKEVPCLINCGVFTEGTDLPGIRTVIVARPTRNISLYTQMVGRGLRRTAEKTRCLLIDCASDVDARKMCIAPTLLGIRMEDVPQRKISGDLMKMSSRLAEEMDNVHSWVRGIHNVELWAKEENYDTHGVAYVKRYNGSMFVMCRDKSKGTAWIIEQPDALGNTEMRRYRVMWKKLEPMDVREMPMQKALDAVRRELERNYRDEEKIWDTGLIIRWPRKPITEKQLNYIRSLYRGLYGKEPDEKEMKSMTTVQGSQVINRLVFETYDKQLSDEEQKREKKKEKEKK